MSVTAVKVQGLGKEYRIGKASHLPHYPTLQETIIETVAGMLRRNKNAADAQAGRVWALKDFDLTVEEGEVVGIIGRNGSGKSTLLKILSDIVEPTEGRAEIYGRVASLLEVGTGFHGELSGRENVFLNGAILGMNQQEVRRNFDQIVEFSGIGQYIDTPVKRYSSGMYLRLAFAVAAHLRPEVLIVDEVLAVGDFEFQQRCIGRMREVGQDGRTVLFVSHNMAAVESLCSRCVLIDRGHLTRDGAPYEITREYRRNQTHIEGNALADLERIDGPNRKVRVLSNARLVDEQGDITTSIPVSRAFEIRIGVNICTDLSDLLFVVRIENAYGDRMMTVRSPSQEAVCRDLQGNHEIACHINEFPLAPGIYRIGLAVFSRDQMIDEVNGALSLTVTDANLFGEGRGAVAGVCVARSEWRVGPRVASFAQTAAAPIAPIGSVT
jgi:lipopolysaccharide transport system ATP-binding protein